MRGRVFVSTIAVVMLLALAAAARSHPTAVDGTPLFHDKAIEAAALYGTGSPPSTKTISDSLDDVRTFWAYNFSGSNYYQTNATLKAVTDYAYVYVQNRDSAGNDVLNDGGGTWNGYITQTDVNAISGEFNNTVYTSVRNVFGEERPAGVDGDSRVTILLLDIDDDYAKNRTTLASFTAGYFTSINEYSTGIYANSNQRKMIYIDTYPLIESGNTTSIAPTTDHADKTGDGANASYATIAHEFQHMIHWWKDPNEDTWVDEGASMLAQWVSGYGHPTDHINQFKTDTDNPLLDWNGQPADYGKVYLWTLYLYEQAGGANFIGKLVNESANGVDGVNSVLTNMGSAYRFHNYFRWWTVANYVDDTSIDIGQFGYQNLNVTARSSMIHSGIHMPYPKYGANSTVNNWAADYLRFMVTTENNNLSLYFNGTSGNFTLWLVKENTNTNATEVAEINLDENNTNGTNVSGFGPAFNSVVLIPSFSNYVDTTSPHDYYYATNGSNITGETILEFGYAGTADGQFRSPKGIAVDLMTERIFVLDTGSDRVQVFDLEGNFLDSFGSDNALGLGLTDPEGIAVDQDGNVYVADTYNDRVVVYTRELVVNHTFGEYGEENGNFIYPVDVSVKENGTIVVSEDTNSRIQFFYPNGTYIRNITGIEHPKGLHVGLFNKVYVTQTIDQTTHGIKVYNENLSLNFTAGTYGTGDGQFGHPEGVSVDYSGYIYIADTVNNRVQVLNPNGSHNRTYGAEGSQLGNFSTPYAIEVDNTGRVYVADTGNNRIQMFRLIASDKPEVYTLRTDIDLSNGTPRELDYINMNITVRNVGEENATNFTVRVSENTPNGTLIDERVISITSGGTQTYNIPWRARLGIPRITVVVDVNDTVNESNEYNNNIWNYVNVNPLTPAYNDSGFSSPHGGFVSADGSVYFANKENHSIMVFNRVLNLTATIGDNTTLDDPSDVAVNSTGYIFVANPDLDNIVVFTPAGAYAGVFKANLSAPQGLYIDGNDRVYVANTLANNTIVYNPDGSILRTIGSSGTGDGQFNTTMDVAVDSLGRIIISDRFNHRLQVFNADGTFNMTIGEEGNTNGNLSQPHGIYVDRDNVIYVADRGNNRIQLFNPNGSFNFTFTGNNTMNAPEGVAVDGFGRVYVANTGNDTTLPFNNSILAFDVYTGVSDTTAPAVTLTSPADAWMFNTSNATLNYSVTEANTITNCSLYLNESVVFEVNQTDNNVSAGANHFSLTDVADGYYTWNVECTDNATNTGRAPSNKTFRIDTTLYPPAVTAVTPANNTLMQPYTTNITVSLTTNMTAGCRYANTPGTAFENMTRQFNTTNSTTHTLNLTNLSNNQTILLYVRCGRVEGVNNTADYLLNYSISAPDVVLNEMMPNGVEWVELYNRGETQVNLSGWVLNHTQDGNDIAINTVINSSGYTLINLSSTMVSINESYDKVLLYDRDGELADNYTINSTLLNASWNNIPENYSIGRRTDGGENWTSFNETLASPGSSNEGTASVEYALSSGWSLISIPVVA